MLSILLTAPTGALAIAVSGPRLLRQAKTGQGTGDKREIEAMLDGPDITCIEMNP